MNLATPFIPMTPEDLISQGVVVYGVKGSGKSNTVATIIEEAGETLPFMIFDPHGELWTLRQRFDVLVVGDSDPEHLDLKIEPDQAADIVAACYERGISVVFNLRYMSYAARDATTTSAIRKLWELAIRQFKPYCVVLEEAHRFIPEGGKQTEAFELVEQVALEGRKFMLGMVVCTQRPAKVTKSVSEQMGIRFLHRVYGANDIKAYQNIIPGKKPAQVEDMIGALRVGQAIVVKDHVPHVVTMRRRYTPDASDVHVGKVEKRPIDAAMLAELRKLIAGDKPAPVDGVDVAAIRDEYEQRISALVEKHERQLAEKDAAHQREIEQLQKQIRLLEQRPVIQATAVEQGRLMVREKRTTTTERTVEFQSTRARTMAIGRQQRAFDGLISQLEDLAPRYKRVLLYLAENPKSRFKAVAIAQMLDYSVSRVQESARKLRDLGLIEHWDDETYQSQIGVMFHKRFALLDHQALFRQLVNAIDE